MCFYSICVFALFLCFLIALLLFSLFSVFSIHLLSAVFSVNKSAADLCTLSFLESICHIWSPLTTHVSHYFNVLQHNNPMYLRDLLTTHNHSRNLRSSSQHLLSVGYMWTVSSSRCFKHSAALNWNDLPYDIRACDSVNVFKRKLKTHLFNIAYPT